MSHPGCVTSKKKTLPSLQTPQKGPIDFPTDCRYRVCHNHTETTLKNRRTPTSPRDLHATCQSLQTRFSHVTFASDMVDPEVTSIRIHQLPIRNLGSRNWQHLSWWVVWWSILMSVDPTGQREIPATEKMTEKFRYLKCFFFFLRCTQLVGLFWNERTCLYCKYRYTYILYISYTYTHLLFKQKTGVRQTTHSLKSLASKKRRKKKHFAPDFLRPNRTPWVSQTRAASITLRWSMVQPLQQRWLFSVALRVGAFLGPWKHKTPRTYEKRTWKLKF